MTSVERILHYADQLEVEEPHFKRNPKNRTELVELPAEVNVHWPTLGEIKIEHLVLAYGTDSEPVLKDVSLSIGNDFIYIGQYLTLAKRVMRK